MATATRALDRAARQTLRQVRDLGDELREGRISLGLSQVHVCASARVSRSRLGDLEAGRARSITLDELNRLGAVLGLRPSVRLYPDGPPVRDVAHATKLAAFLGGIRAPLRYGV